MRQNTQIHTHAQGGMFGLAFVKIDKLSLERTTYAHTGCSKDLFKHCIQFLYHICWQRIEKQFYNYSNSEFYTIRGSYHF